MLNIDCHTLPHLMLMGRFRQRRGWNHDGRTLEGHLLVIMIQGSCSFTVGDKTHHLGRGDAMIIPAGEYYRPHTNEGCEYYYFHFSDYPSQSAAPTNRMLSLPFCVPAEEEERQEILLSAQRIFDTQTAELRPECALLADLYLTQLLLQLAGNATEVTHHEVRPPALLGKIELYIRQHVTEKITLAELSSHFSVSKQYITRLFRRHLNTTPTTYIHRAKLENARWLLVHSTMNITEISDYMGFSGSYYFVRLFKKYYNVTPLQYAREMLRR